jgi:cytochrome c nitrite reductase small subunit
MSPGKKKKISLYLLILVAILFVGGVFLAFGPPGIYAKSETPGFCGSCHVLEMEYEAWFHSGAHARITCVDCHLPNDTFARHLVWKTIDGLKDALAFHSGRVSDTIRLSERGAGFVRENCQRCHTEINARINEDRRCWDCHRKMTHKNTGAILTRTLQ